MRAMYDLRAMLCEELDEIAKKPEMGAGDLELVHKLTDTIKNIDKICMMEETGEYSQRGDWEMDAYGRGNSYANRGKHYVRGHYSRDGQDNRSYGRDGGYSRHNAREHMLAQLEDMMGSASGDRERDAIRRCMEQLERE